MADWLPFLLLSVATVGWMSLWWAERRRADRYRQMLTDLLDALERSPLVHVHRKCVCDAVWLCDDAEVTDAAGVVHGRYSCQPEAEVIP